jgi:hypothetical protein
VGKYYSVILFALILFFVIWLSLLFEPKESLGQPYNTTYLVNTTVNITNSGPIVFDVTLQTPIDLIAYDNLTVECNASVFDYDNNTQGLNATLHQSTVSPIGTADQNFRYLNTSCTQKTPTDYYTNFSCTFTLRYFANNGTWYCNATAIDTLQGVGTNQSNQATINPLVAIKMDSVLDYGNVGANQISNDTVANVTNVGNRNANISVLGYGATEGDGLAMVCTFGSIPVSNERYNITSNNTFGLMNQLTGASAMIPRFYVPQRTDEAIDSTNQTYWKLFIPAGAGGICNGKILFTASDRGA